MDAAISNKLEALFTSLNRSDGPGCTVAISRDGRPIFRRGYGLADVRQGAANLPSTIMPIGSVSKQFTCAALLCLEASGKLCLDDPVGKWLTELPEAQHAPTLDQLMRHQGGVRCYLDQWMFNGYRTMPAGLPWEIQARQEDLNFLPGSHSAYSNGGYLLLSKVVERASGMSFAAFLKLSLFTPCGMFATELPASNGAALAGSATTFVDEGGLWLPAPAMTDEAFGDGGIVSNVDDLLRWGQFLKVSSGPVNLRSLSAPGRPRFPGPADYRFGLIFQNWRGITLGQHAGGLPGANSVFVMAPDHGVELVLLGNHPMDATRLGLRMLEIVLENCLEEEPPAPRASDYSDLLGTYFAPEAGFLFLLSESEGKLSLSPFGEGSIPLESCSCAEDELPFWADAGTAQIRFRRGAEAGTLDYFDGVGWTEACKLGSTLHSAGSFAHLEGVRFHSPQAAATIEIQRNGGQLQLKVTGKNGNSAYNAKGVSPDLIRFWPDEFPTSKLARLIETDGRVQSIVISTSRTRAMSFARMEPTFARKQS